MLYRSKIDCTFVGKALLVAQWIDVETLLKVIAGERLIIVARKDTQTQASTNKRAPGGTFHLLSKHSDYTYKLALPYLRLQPITYVIQTYVHITRNLVGDAMMTRRKFIDRRSCLSSL